VATDRGGREVATWKLVGTAALLVVLLWFVAANFVEVEVRVLLVRTRVRLGWALLAAASGGFLLGWTAARVRHRR
jgi:uncharacterized integral membrane protein